MSTSTVKPLTVIVTRRVLPGREAEYEQLMTGMQAAAATFPGHMGGFLVRPEADRDGCWRTLFAFDSEAHLQAWSDSAERRQWLAQMAPITEGDGARRVLSGLETWFSLPTVRTKSPPPRWKMALMTWSGIFPLVLLASFTITPLLGRWLPMPLTVLIVTGLITACMTWLYMPTLVRLLAGWLYPPTRD